jgi:acyl-CoA thioesterase YciA
MWPFGSRKKRKTATPFSDAPPPRKGPPEAEPMIRTIAMPADANPAGDVFGGWLMAQMDLAASAVATRRAKGRCATVAVDAMSFLAPVAIGDEVSLYARLLSTGKSSMRVAVEAWRRHRDEEEVKKVTEAIFTHVAIDKDRKARPLP